VHIAIFDDDDDDDDGWRLMTRRSSSLIPVTSTGIRVGATQLLTTPNSKVDFKKFSALLR
jgi:hypothetical protein